MMNTFLIGLCWKIPAAMLIAAVSEYLIHRYILHNRRFKTSYRMHAIEHHAEGYNNPRPHIRLYIGDYFALLAFLPWPIYRALWLNEIGGWSGLTAIGTVVAFHYYFWNTLHASIHKCEVNWTTKCWWHKYFEKQHLNHHIDVRTNYGVVFILPFDWLFKTRFNRGQK